MKMIRSLRQPGPIHPIRIECFRGNPHMLRFSPKVGVTLNEAITGPMVEAGSQCGAITFRGMDIGPFRYVIPSSAEDESHVAYFSAPRAPSGTTRIEQANATFGWAEGEPFIHCHAVWIEADGSRCGGHILPAETIVRGSGAAIACGFSGIRIDAKPDPETNFTLFQPVGAGGSAGRGLVARIKPNEDIVGAVETIARTHGITNAVVHGGLGSLIGASFTDGGRVTCDATEVLVREGHIRDGRAALDLLVVDMQGKVHEGWLERGENPICITFDVVLEELGDRFFVEMRNGRGQAGGG
jgi:predicted DNA-binding protein with PD1-like motif